MNLQKHRHLLAGVILAAGTALLLAGCMGSDSASSTTSSLRKAIVSTTAESVADAGQEVVLSVEDAYSSFQSKDPFIQQQVPATEPTNTSETSTSPPTSSTTTTTAPSSTTTTSTSTTSTSSTTSTTASWFTHMLQVLAVGVVSDAPAVTFQVDNTVYQDQRIGDTVSTSWGDVKVVDINTGNQVVTILHDGQTLNMTVGQILFE